MIQEISMGDRNKVAEELQLAINNCQMNDLICQTEIKTEEDKSKNGYLILFTLDEFRKAVPNVDPAKIWYGPVLACTCVYFNRDTMAAVNFPLLAYQKDTDLKSADRWKANFPNAVADAEAHAAKGEILHGGMIFSGRMRLDYIVECVRKGIRSESMYHDVLSLMACSDFGFDQLPEDVIKRIMEIKSKEDKEQTVKALDGLPEEITVYRGGNSRSTPPEKAFYWSTDINVAMFFACRLGPGPAYIAQAVVRKEDILEYDVDSPEKDVIIYPQNVKDLHIRRLHGAAYLKTVLPQVTDSYFDSLEKMTNVEYQMPLSSPHGPIHSRRVMLFCLLLAREAGLSEEDREVLVTSAIYHDCERDNDGVDLEHGFYSADVYESSTNDPDPLVSAICEYHCKPDEEFDKALEEQAELRTQKERALRLFQLFKDADALDLVRFNIQTLDYTMLRTEEARNMPLVAYLLQNVG